jgi:hypothetical protein
LLIKELGQGHWVDAGDRDKRTNPEYHQRAHQEQETLAQLGKLGDTADTAR